MSSFEANTAAGDDVALRGTGAAHAQHAEGEHRSPLSRFFVLIRPDRRDLTAIVIFSLVIGLLGLATPIAVEALVNSVAFGGLVQPVIVLAAMLFGCLALASFLVGLQTYLAELIQRRLFVRTLADLAVRVPRVRWEALDHEHGPELINRFFDVVTLQKVTAAIVLDGIAIGLSTIIGMVVLAFYHPLLLGFDLLLLVSLAILVFLLGRHAVTTSIRESRAKYAVAGWLEELAQHGLAFHLEHGRRLTLARADALPLCLNVMRSKTHLLGWSTIVPWRRQEFRRELTSFFDWYNEHRPHTTLQGCTPNEVYHRCFPENRRPRFQTRSKWPRGAPCAKPSSLVKGRAGAKVDLQVEFHAERKHLPIVMLRRAA